MAYENERVNEHLLAELIFAPKSKSRAPEMLAHFAGWLLLLLGRSRLARAVFLLGIGFHLVRHGGCCGGGGVSGYKVQH